MLKCPYFAAVPQRYLSHPYCQNAWPTARDAKCVVSSPPPPLLGPKKGGRKNRKQQSHSNLYPLGSLYLTVLLGQGSRNTTAFRAQV